MFRFIMGAIIREFMLSIILCNARYMQFSLVTVTVTAGNFMS